MVTVREEAAIQAEYANVCKEIGHRVAQQAAASQEVERLRREVDGLLRRVSELEDETQRAKARGGA